MGAPALSLVPAPPAPLDVVALLLADKRSADTRRAYASDLRAWAGNKKGWDRKCKKYTFYPTPFLS